jgi:hypothetical protein
MLWDIRAKMRPALSVIDMIPNIHRTPALTSLRKAALDGRAGKLSLSREDAELAFYDGTQQLTSPIGARLLLALYTDGRLKLKKPPVKDLPKLTAYIATEAAFRAEVAAIIAQEDAQRTRLAEIIADPDCARADELTPYLIDKVITAKLGYGVYGSMKIAGVTCHKTLKPAATTDHLRAEGEIACWWQDASGARHGDSEG